MSSKIDTNGIDEIKDGFERISKLVKDKDGILINPKEEKTFTKGNAFLHTGNNEEKTAKFERDNPEEFAYWRQFFEQLGDVLR